MHSPRIMFAKTKKQKIMKNYILALKRYADFKGKSSRAEFSERRKRYGRN